MEQNCGSCGLVFRLCARGLCDFCREGPRARLGKQREVRNYLETNLPEWPWDSYDKTPELLAECGGRERPDFFWDSGHYAVVLEVDEHQHQGYPEACECTRMVNIMQAVGRPIFFVRYNPDEYVTGDALPQWHRKRRLDLLCEWLKAALVAVPLDIQLDCTEVTMPTGCLHLFFDGFTQAAIRWTLLS